MQCLREILQHLQTKNLSEKQLRLVLTMYYPYRDREVVVRMTNKLETQINLRYVSQQIISLGFFGKTLRINKQWWLHRCEGKNNVGYVLYSR